MKIKELCDKIKLSQEAYYNGSEIISDDEYDALIYELSLLDPNNPLIYKVGSEPTNEWKKEKHLTSLGSLNKVNYPKEMEKWINDSLNNEETVVIEKLDGLSIGLQYIDGILSKAVLRGNGDEGENILKNVLKMKGVITSINNFSGTIRGEIILTKSDHKAHFEEYSNPRNAASGICRRFDGKGSEHLSLMVYDVISDNDFKLEQDKLSFLANQKFILPNYYVCKKSNDVNDLWSKYQSNIRDNLNYEIDGLVVYCNNLSVQMLLGETNMRPKGKMAFKFANQFVKTTVTKIEWLTGNSGRITPRAWFNPVNLLGSTIEKASIYNIAYIEKLGLSVGAEVLVCKANEIIPRIEKVVKPSGNIENIPELCPSCNYKLSLIGENLQCLNNDNCKDQIIGRIKNWVSELNILELGDTLIEKLVQEGLVSSPADLYCLKTSDLASLDRMGEKSAKNVYNSIWKVSSIGLDQFIGGLSIPMIGSSTIRLIMDSGYSTLEDLRSLNVTQLENIKGIGPSRAESLIVGLEKYKNIIDLLLKNGLQIKEKIIGKLTGCKIAITGSTKNKRSFLEKFITDNGGENKSSVGSSCTHLVIADINSTSSKAVSARKLNIKLIEEDSLLNFKL